MDFYESAQSLRERTLCQISRPCRPSADTTLSPPTRLHVRIVVGHRVTLYADIRAMRHYRRRHTAHRILTVRHRFQVLRVDARRHTTQMVNTQTVGNRPYRSFVGNSVRVGPYTTQAHLPITPRFRTLPYPARRHVPVVFNNPSNTPTVDAAAMIVLTWHASHRSRGYRHPAVAARGTVVGHLGGPPYRSIRGAKPGAFSAPPGTLRSLKYTNECRR